MMRTAASFVLALAIVVPLAVAQQPVPVGPEFQVNTWTTFVQVDPAVAGDSAGNFIVVWENVGGSVQGQRYNSAGVPQGPEFSVDIFATSGHLDPEVAVDGAGNFVVVWVVQSNPPSDTDRNVHGQRFDASGTPQGAAFQVNTYTTGRVFFTSVAADAAGNFVVAWGGYGAGSDSSGYGIQARRYDSAGTPQGLQFQVNSYTTGGQSYPRVASDASGNFVVVWASPGSLGTDTSSSSVQARRFNSSGTPQGAEFQVNTYTTNSQGDPSVAINADGSFVVVWQSQGSLGTDTSQTSIQAQRYSATGTPLGGEFQVNTYTTYFQSFPSVDGDGTGSFVVTWLSPDYASYDVRGRRYDGSGVPQGAEFQVNTYTTDRQGTLDAPVAVDSAGNFVVVWHSTPGGGGSDDYFSVQAQRFAIPTTTTTTTLPTTDLLPGRIALIKPGTLAKFVAKPAAGDTFAPPASNPVATGGSLRIFDLATTAGDDTYALPVGTPPLGWKGLGSPAGSKGFKYKGAGTPTDPCKVVLVKEKVIKGVCRGTGITLQPPFTGDMGIVLSLGATDRYCARFGGDESKNDVTLTKRKSAPAPVACP